MAYVGHFRLTIGGGLGTNLPRPESWSCTVNVSLGEDAASQTMADDLFDAAGTMIHTAYFSLAAKLEYAKVSVIDTTGHVVGPVYRHDGLNAGTGEGILHPFQCCVVASLRTGERGASKRGRIYLPLPAVPVSLQTGEIGDGDRDAIQALAAAYLTDINDFMGTDAEVVIASSKGYNTPVTGVNVGRVLDTQRRRRRSLAEDFEPATPV